ncbi:hypothetical protein CHUAL_001439 [Chamberlinius hualienensis]
MNMSVGTEHNQFRSSTSNAIATDSDDDSDSDDEKGRFNWKRRKDTTSDCNKNDEEMCNSPAFLESASKFSEALKNSTISRNSSKLDVWTNVLQQRMLVENLHSVGVIRDQDFRNNDRGSESYEYPGWDRPRNNRSSVPIWKMDSDEIHKRLGLKRKRNKRKNGSAKLGHTFQVTAESSETEVVTAITTILREPKEDLISKVVSVLGKEKALQILRMTEDIEAKHGMMTADNSRRRTPGGVYLLLIRNDRHVTKDQMDRIFEEDRRKDALNKKQIIKAVRRRKALENMEAQLDDMKIFPTRAEIVMAETTNKFLTTEKAEMDVEKEPGELTDSDDED